MIKALDHLNVRGSDLQRARAGGVQLFTCDPDVMPLELNSPPTEVFK